MDFRHLGNFISDKEDERKFFRFFQAEKHGFQKRGLIRFGGEEGHMDKRSAALTDKVRDTFFTEVELFCDESAASHQDSVENIIRAVCNADHDSQDNTGTQTNTIMNT